jgi:hypothetical protein
MYNYRCIFIYICILCTIFVLISVLYTSEECYIFAYILFHFTLISVHFLVHTLYVVFFRFFGYIPAESEMQIPLLQFPYGVHFQRNVQISIIIDSLCLFHIDSIIILVIYRDLYAQKIHLYRLLYVPALRYVGIF